MDVLYLIDSLAAGGSEQSLAALAPHLADRGVRLTVGYLAERQGLRREMEAAGARVVALTGPGGRRGGFARARRLVSRTRPQVVHTTLFEADLVGRPAARLARVPVVSSLVNEAYGPAQVRDRNLRRWKVQGARLADATTARLVTRFHAVSYQVADVMTARLHLPPDRVQVVHRGRDPRRLGVRSPERRARARHALGLDADTPVLLAAARQEYQKGLDVLLAALPLVLRQFPRTILLLAGRDGAQTEQLTALAARPGLQHAVRFLGPRDDVGDLLCAADVCVLPTRWEGLPGVLLEAMALRAPIVASDIPAVREAVGDDAALLVPPDRSAALGHALVTALSGPLAAADRASVAHARFLADFTIAACADQMVALYERAMEERSR